MLESEAGPGSDPVRDRLARDLAEAIGARRLELIRDSRGLVVSMPDDAAFSTGSAEATPEARKLIATVGDTKTPDAAGIPGSECIEFQPQRAPDGLWVMLESGKLSR